jgi:hypothetical protein
MTAIQQLIAAYADLSLSALAEACLGPLPKPSPRPASTAREFVWTPWIAYTVQYMPAPAATLLRTLCCPSPSPLQRCAIVALKLVLLGQKCPERVQTLVDVRLERGREPVLVSPQYPFDRSEMRTVEQYHDWIRFVADVRAMHEHGCEHGDLDSSNVMWDQERRRWVMIDVETSGPFSALDVHAAARLLADRFPVLAPALQDPLVLELSQCRNPRSHAPLPLFLDDLVDLAAESVLHRTSLDSILTDDAGSYFFRSCEQFRALVEEVAALPFPEDSDWVYELGEYVHNVLAETTQAASRLPRLWLI